MHDHPALAAACADADKVVPPLYPRPTFFGNERGSSRTDFLRESLVDLDGSLRQLGGRLIVRSGTGENILPTIVTEVDATTVYYISDYTPYSIQRDKTLADTMAERGVTFVGCSGKLVVSGGMKLVTKQVLDTKSLPRFGKPGWACRAERSLMYRSASSCRISQVMRCRSLTISPHRKSFRPMSCQAVKQPGGHDLSSFTRRHCRISSGAKRFESRSYLAYECVFAFRLREPARTRAAATG